MDKNEVLIQLQEIFRDTLDNEEVVLTFDTTANDVEEWDSLTHIHLVVSIEKHFKVRFTSKEIQSWKNIGELADGILAKK
ncbi:MAG: acyl carrier protein [Bacteroidales bacterium]|nr:acyl carrier protein [Bacteroidales bacterium]MBK9356509.1 acyl carrier protein [Bacteroidales bacterium]